MEKRSVEIVLVEDNPADAELTMRALKRNQLVNEIVRLKDGAEAIEYFFPADGQADRPALPQLILLDLKLPKIDGLEVLRQLKAGTTTRRIPVVVLTSSQEESDLVKSYDLGVNSYLVKPVDFEQFVEAVNHLGLYWLLLNQIPN